MLPESPEFSREDRAFDRIFGSSSDKRFSSSIIDLNATFTQVLSDGTNTYLYGVTRIAQQNGTDTEYYLGDALNSVRQLTNSTGDVSLARAYDPYGNTILNVGSEQTAYGYTGEPQQTDLIYLRARYLSSQYGRFISKDPFNGFDTNPISQNPYVYGYANPITNTDHTGENPIFECIALLALTAEGGLTITIGVEGCILLLGATTIALMALPPAVKELEKGCPSVINSWEDISNLPVQDSNFSPKPTPEKSPIPVPYRIPTQTETRKPPIILYHYTKASNIPLIIATGLKPSIRLEGKPSSDAQWGDGQYLTDLTPAEASSQTRFIVSKALFNDPWKLGTGPNYLIDIGWIGIDTTGLPIERKASLYGARFPGRGIYLNANMVNLPIADRVSGTGIVTFQPSPSGYR